MLSSSRRVRCALWRLLSVCVLPALSLRPQRAHDSRQGPQLAHTARSLGRRGGGALVASARAGGGCCQKNCTRLYVCILLPRAASFPLASRSRTSSLYYEQCAHTQLHACTSRVRECPVILCILQHFSGFARVAQHTSFRTPRQPRPGTLARSRAAPASKRPTSAGGGGASAARACTCPGRTRTGSGRCAGT